MRNWTKSQYGGDLPSYYLNSETISCKVYPVHRGYTFVYGWKDSTERYRWIGKKFTNVNSAKRKAMEKVREFTHQL